MVLEKAWEALSKWQKEKNVEAVELFALQKHGRKIQRKDCKLEAFEPFREEGVGVRVLARGNFGFSYATSFDPLEVRETAARALENASVLETDPAAGFPEPGSYPSWDPPQAQELSVEEALSVLTAVEDAALEVDPRVKRLQEVSLKQVFTSLFLVNSLGVNVQVFLPHISLVAVTVAEEAGEAQMGWEWQSALSPQDLNPKAVGQEAARRAVGRLGARVLTSTRIPILLPPHIAVDFLDLVSSALCGDQVVKGKSPLADKQGQKIFSSAVTLVDDGLLPQGIESRPFDDEGMPQQTTVLVREGVLEGFLFDLYWGRRAGVRSTGNARRGSFKSPPLVEVTNFYLQPGESSPEKLRNRASKVFEVLEVLGMHTADPVSGDFSVGVAGLLYEKGDPKPVTGMALSGNVFELFHRVADLGKDLRFYGSIGAPSILIEEMDLSGS